MTKDELIKNIKNREVDIVAFEERCKAREKKFVEQARRIRADANWYNFRYGARNDS
jgi:hypothetical protein